MKIHNDWRLQNIDNDNIRIMLSYPPEYYKKRLRKVGFTGKTTKLLDAGCGGGYWAAAAANFNREVYGIDATKKYLAVAEEIQRSLKITNCKLEIGKIESLPYPDNHFDFIISYCVWMYTDRPKSLQEMYRVLKPGGKIYLGAVAGLGWYLKLILQGIKEGNRELIFESIKAIRKKIHTNENESRRLLKNLGFKISSLNSDGKAGNIKIKVQPIYSSKFLGFWNVYEILAEKME